MARHLWVWHTPESPLADEDVDRTATRRHAAWTTDEAQEAMQKLQAVHVPHECQTAIYHSYLPLADKADGPFLSKTWDNDSLSTCWMRFWNFRENNWLSETSPEI